MKNYLSQIIAICLMLFSMIGYSQSVKRIEDPHIRAQQNRQVFKSWGNFLPEPKHPWWALGAQTNLHHTLTWGNLSPNQNGRYRKGADIRPLSVTGEQTQRMLSLAIMKSQSDEIKKHSDEIGKTALSELYNYTGGAISEVDPLWMLYYKRMLKDVKDYNLTTFTNKLNPKQKNYMVDNGILNWFDNEMQRLSERLNGAFSATMDRGSRIINYHRIYLEYEKILNNWNNHKQWSETLINLVQENKSQKGNQNIDFSDWKNDDVAIMNKVIEEAKKLN